MSTLDDIQNGISVVFIKKILKECFKQHQILLLNRRVIAEKMENREKAGKLSISRRQFISGAAALALAGAAGLTGLSLKKEKVIAADDLKLESAEHQWVMVIDLRRCEGFQDCTKECKKFHYLPPGVEWLKVRHVKGTLGQLFYMPMPCMHCENPACVRVCPVKATYKTKDGATVVDQQKCIGCRMCMAACPYHVRQFNWNDYPEVPSTLAKPTPEFPVPGIKGTVGKCEFCLHNTRFGKLTPCAGACRKKAIYNGDLVSDICANPDGSYKLSTFLKENDAFRYKEELNTGPRVYYITGHGQIAEEQ
jgi:molybdopterin-containing oxidoreductase family iron-sulfur binding subunit